MIYFIISLLLGIGLIWLLNRPSSIQSNSILVIDLSRPLVDRPDLSKIEQFIYPDQAEQSLYRVLRAIHRAQKDEHIAGLLLKNQVSFQTGWARLKALRQALHEFKQSGKPILSWQSSIDQKTMYVVAVADQIGLHPLGTLTWKGLAIEQIYFKSAMDQYGIQAQAIRAGRYKSAVEPFLNDEMSQETRQQLSSILNDLVDELFNAVAQDRHLSVSSVRQDSHIGLLDAQQAKQKGYIDKIINSREWDDQINQLTRSKNWRNKQIKPSHYHDLTRNRQDQIAVIYLEGEIRSESELPEQVSAESAVKALRKAIRNDRIKAVVLRIDSPGGEVIASDRIYQQALALSQKKPLVVSMGDVAASGGYWIALAGQMIYAQPNTITGSIGVFALSLNIGKLVQNIGLSVQSVKTAPLADMNSLFKSQPEPVLKHWQAEVDHIYDEFKQKVAKSRNMSLEQVESVAQGRIWSGQKALSLKLVDQLGGLEEAIEAAAQKADLKQYQLVEISTDKKWWQKLSELDSQARWPDLPVNHIMARMPYLNWY